MKILQNIDLIEFQVTSAGGNFYLPKDRLFCGKKITRITLVSSATVTLSPIGLPVVVDAFLPYVSVSLYNNNSKEIMRNMQGVFLVPGINADYKINSMLDYSMSVIKVAKNNAIADNTINSLLVVVEYQNANRTPLIEPSNSLLVQIPAVAGKTRYNLKDYIISSLTNKSVYRIVVDGAVDGFITIREKTGKVFNQIPLAMLKAFIETENIYLDALNIDFENTYIETPNEITSTIEITFIYE